MNNITSGLSINGSFAFVDGDFKSKMGDCKHHCSPTCHPGQIDPDNWQYGCVHPAWPSNQVGDFCPLVRCDGLKSKCELKGAKFLGRYKGGLRRRVKNALAKANKYQTILDELKVLEASHAK